MNKEEAITALGDRNNLLWGMSKEEQKYYSEALDMAISALSENKADMKIKTCRGCTHPCIMYEPTMRCCGNKGGERMSDTVKLVIEISKTPKNDHERWVLAHGIPLDDVKAEIAEEICLTDNPYTKETKYTIEHLRLIDILDNSGCDNINHIGMLKGENT